MAAVFGALQYATESASATMDRTKLAVVSEKFPLIVRLRPCQLTEDLKQRKKKGLEALNNNYQTPAPANETIFQISCTEVNLKACFSKSEHCGCYSHHSKIAAFYFLLTPLFQLALVVLHTIFLTKGLTWDIAQVRIRWLLFLSSCGE